MPITHRRSIVVEDFAAFDAVRLQLARAGAGHGVRIGSVQDVVARLAGGFFTGITSESLSIAIAGALEDLPDAEIGDLSAIRRLPGARRSVASSLRRAWRACIDLEGNSDLHPRIAVMATIEAEVLRRLPEGQLRPGDLVVQALARLQHVAKVLGEVEFRHLPDLDRCWRPILLALTKQAPTTWDSGPFLTPHWVEQIASLTLRRSADVAPSIATYACASPRHEVTEAFRWAREMIATGQAKPQEIAVAGASTEAFDEIVAAMAEEASLPIHFAHGRPALLTPEGQAAAALADVLIRGLSQEKVRRLVGRVRRSALALDKLPDDWATALNRDATLSTSERWRLALSGADRKAVSDVLMPVIDLLAQGPVVAARAGDILLSGPAKSLWVRALMMADGSALDRELAALRVPENNAENDAGTSIMWGQASSLPASARPWVWLVGLNSQSWPRRSSEDPLLPDHVLGELKPEETSVSARDRASFHAIHSSASKKVVRSFSRREPGGRRLGISPLITLEEANKAEDLLRTRIPHHAMSVPDRLLARPLEFAALPEASAAASCWTAWRSAELTAHDGLISCANHPAIVRALDRVQSASSLSMLLRNPIGFTFKYALGMRASELDADPLTLDGRAFGDLVHDILEAASILLGHSGLAGLDRTSAAAVVADVLPGISSRWQTEKPVPPSLVWEDSKVRAASVAAAALAHPFATLDGQQSFVEVPFGRVPETDGNDQRDGHDAGCLAAPWDTAVEVRVSHTDMRIGGFIDRLDLAGNRTAARVIDYKTGRRHIGIQLRGGRELQRCLYAYAVRALIPSAADNIEAGLLYPSAGQAFDRLTTPDDTLARLSSALVEASESLRQGLALPGVAAGLHGKGPKEFNADREYDDLAFALPVVPGTTLDLKKTLAEARFSGIPEFWREK